MPNIKSAKKRVLVIETKTARNKANRSALKTAVKKANAALDAKDANSAEAVRAAIKKLDQSVSKGLLHKNAVAKKKSVLARKLNQAAANG